MDKILEISNVKFVYHTRANETIALNNLSLDVKKEEFISIVGPSGCGKTTILSLIAGLLKPSEGEILLEGKKIEKISSNVGYMFQRDNLFDWLNNTNNITLGLKIQKKLTPESKNYALDLANKYGLGKFINHYPKELSGGMRQRIALIRTLATRPKILLLDEPFSALDYQTRLSVQDDVYDIIKNEQKSAILVTHDISEAICMSDRIIVLTKSPAKVKTIIALEFPKNLTPFERRKTPIFHEYFNKVWEELQ